MDFDHFLTYRAALLGIVSQKELSEERKRGLILSLSLQRGVEKLICDSDFHRQVGKTQREQELLAQIHRQEEALKEKVMRITERGIDLITPFSMKYPDLGRFPREDLPPAFLALGNTQLLFDDRIAVVGKRDHNDWGRKFTVNICRELVRRGSVIVSGMARGLDSIAHRATLEAGGKTIAILPQGISVASSKIDRFNEFIEEKRMLVLSPFKPEAYFSRDNALRRNSIICGVSRELYSGDEGGSGGTYNTVRMALSRGLSVYLGKNPDMDISAYAEFDSKCIWLDMNGRHC